MNQKYLSVLIGVLFATTVPLVSSATEHSAAPSQDEAEQNVLWRMEGRARPSRRALKQQVKEDMLETGSSFIDYRLQLRHAQQRRTQEDVQKDRSFRTGERRADMLDERLQERMKALEHNRRRLERKTQNIRPRTVRSVPVDVRKCSNLHVRARRMCVIDLRRQQRIHMHREEVQDIREDLNESDDVTVGDNAPFMLRVDRKLPMKPLSRRSTDELETGPAVIEFPEEPQVEEDDSEDDQSDENNGVQSQTSG